MKARVLAVLALGVGLVLPCTVSAKVRIRVWHPWGGITQAGLMQVAKEYEKLNPGVQVDMVSVPNGIETNEKFFASMAAGSPPEIILVDGTQVCQWAAKKVLTNLNSLVKRDGVKAADFFTPSWSQCLYKGGMFSMPFQSDPNFPLGYNKAAFAEAGLAGAPKTFGDLEEYARKLDKFDANGSWQRAGFVPKAIPWWGNILFTWGWAFGADFYDDQKDTYRLDDPKAVEAMDWLNGFYSRRGAKFATVAGAGYAGFVKGRIAISPLLSDFRQYLATDKSAKGFQWGYGFIHGPAESPSAWVGGWTMAIPANAKSQAESWKFMKWICWDRKGTTASWKAVGWMPSARTSDVYSAANDDDTAAFVDTLKIAEHHRPVSLATPMVFGVMETLGPQMASGKKSAAQVLKEANAQVQKELARLLAQVKGR